MAEAPDTKDWKAWENRQPGPGGGPNFIVTGKVKITSTNQKPRLTEATPQGPVAEALLLDLTIESEGAGVEPTDPWAEARFEATVKPGQYTSVEIRWGGDIIATAGVAVIE